MPSDQSLFGASVFLHTEGRILLQKRTHDAPRHPDSWGSFGGHSKPGETSTSAAIRELHEELGLSLTAADMTLICTIPVGISEHAGEVHYFAAPLVVPLSELKLGEGSGFALFLRDELHDLKLVPHTQLALHQFFGS